MSGVEHGREPCPDRILDDIGTAFSMGVLGGSAWHFLRGMKNSPRGERMLGGTGAVRLNAPRIGGSFAVWGGVFSSFDCALVYLRKKEDPWNAIAAGAGAGGFLQLRQGLRSAGKSAMVGGVLLALIEGTGILLNRLLSQLPPPEDQMGPVPAGIGMGMGGGAGMAFPPPSGSSMPGYAMGIGGGGSEAGVSSGSYGGDTSRQTLQGSAQEGSYGSLPSGASTSSFPSSSSTSSSSSSSSSSSKKSSWFGGWLGGGGGGNEEVAAGGNSSSPDRERLDSFDVSPPPPFPHFGSGSNDSFSFK